MDIPKISLLTATHCRAEKLANVALPSVLAQTSHSFKWIIVNDGRDRATRDIVTAIKSGFSLTYLEIDHPTSGFGLCHARNAGLKEASGEIVAYLDDDNTLKPNFISETLRFFQDNPLMKCSMARQSRRRNAVKNGHIKQGKPFVAPQQNATAESLVRQDDLFDSNGFAHYQYDAPCWNPEYRVFADYEYFLQCLSLWGCSSFKLNPQVLVNYIQTSDGVIGKSNYKLWATELQSIYDKIEKYSILKQVKAQVLVELIKRYEFKHQQGMNLLAFN